MLGCVVGLHMISDMVLCFTVCSLKTCCVVFCYRHAEFGCVVWVTACCSC